MHMLGTHKWGKNGQTDRYTCRGGNRVVQQLKMERRILQSGEGLYTLLSEK